MKAKHSKFKRKATQDTPRKTLTPAQRGRFWVSVGELIEAARAGNGGVR